METTVETQISRDTAHGSHCLPRSQPLLRSFCIPSTQSSKSSVGTAGCGLTTFCLKRHRGGRQLVVLLGLGAHDGGLDRQLCRCREQDGRAEETGLGGRPTETATLQLPETERDSAPGGRWFSGPVCHSAGVGCVSCP